ncbi:hypothetical protein [Staphylococcus phage vB_SauM-T-SE-E1]|nr:hypothetical protein [Staphylococcus phage vB_SauM-V1SA15]
MSATSRYSSHIPYLSIYLKGLDCPMSLISKVTTYYSR